MADALRLTVHMRAIFQPERWVAEFSDFGEELRAPRFIGRLNRMLCDEAGIDAFLQAQGQAGKMTPT